MAFSWGKASRSPPGDDRSEDMASASHVDSMTKSDADMNTEDLEQSKTCDGTCCDHSSGCRCVGCFCRTRAHIRVDANQEAYAGEGGAGAGVNIPFLEISTGVNIDWAVNALAARLATFTTDGSNSLAIPIAQHGAHRGSLVGPPSLSALRERDAHESFEDRMRMNVGRLITTFHDDDEMPDIDFPGDHFNTPIDHLPESDFLPFDFESNGLSRVPSHELPPDEICSHSAHESSRNHSVAVRGTGGLFEGLRYATRSQYSFEMPMCFGPLQLVPDCHHSRAAGCA